MDLPGGIETVQERHGEVKDGHVGPKLPREPRSLVPVVRLADDVKRLALEERSQALAEEQMIIGQQDPKRHA